MSEELHIPVPEFPKPINMVSPHRFATVYYDPRLGERWYMDGLREMTAAQVEEFGPWERVYDKTELADLREVLDLLTDPEPCEWDHNHSCQAHGFFYIPEGEKCPNQRAKDLLGITDE